MSELKKLKVLFMGKDKDTVLTALRYLMTIRGESIQIVGVAAPKHGKLWKCAESFGLKTYSNKDLYNDPIKDLDLAVSFLYPRKIKEPYLTGIRLGCINFHPAPLPDIRGVACYSRAILRGDCKYGVTCHFVEEDFDTGDIISIARFAMDPDVETSYSLEKRSLHYILYLFYEVMSNLIERKKIYRTSQKDEKYKHITPIYTRIKDIDKLRTVKDTDTAEEVDRKIRAFWFPPMPGARIVVGGEEFTLINDQILWEIKQWEQQ